MITRREPAISAEEFAAASWHKSSASANGSDCIEHGRTPSGAQLVRDTKDRDGGVLAFDTAAWASFVTAVKRGEFER